MARNTPFSRIYTCLSLEYRPPAMTSPPGARNELRAPASVGDCARENGMPRHLVTGGCGFIGSHLSEALLGSGAEVVVLDDLSTGRRERLPQGAKLVVGDIRDA